MKKKKRLSKDIPESFELDKVDPKSRLPGTLIEKGSMKSLSDKSKKLADALKDKQAKKSDNEFVGKMKKCMALKKDGASPPPPAPNTAQQITSGFNNATGTSGIMNGIKNVSNALGFGKSEKPKESKPKDKEQPKPDERPLDMWDIISHPKVEKGTDDFTQINSEPILQRKESKWDMESLKKLKNNLSFSVAKAAGIGGPMEKSEKNPDEKADAKLGEDVEHLVEDHMMENKEAEQKEGHKIMKKCDDPEFLKKLHSSLKLKKMYGVEMTEKGEKLAERSQDVKAHDSSKGAPTQDEKHANMMNEQNNLEKKYEGFKSVEASARRSGANDPKAVAAAIGRKKYGKEAFQHAAAAGKKMGKTEEMPQKSQDVTMHDSSKGAPTQDEKHANMMNEEKNLDKSQYEKGVHQRGAINPGISMPGALNRMKGSKQLQRQGHKQVLSEIKQMPKANLPKTEKAEELKKPYVSQKQAGFFHTNPEKVGGKKVVEEFDRATKGKHLPKVAKKDSQIKGVHTEAIPGHKPSRGQSEAGKFARNPSKITQAYAHHGHIQKLKELLSMPKPNLPKTEKSMDPMEKKRKK